MTFLLEHSYFFRFTKKDKGTFCRQDGLTNPTQVNKFLLFIYFFHRIFLLCLVSYSHAQFHQFGDQLHSSHGSDCALLLAGPGRSSVYDYNVNLFRGTM